MENNRIKWGCIQPLTGGMYIGAENAIGQAADWVLSYPGLADVKYKEDGTLKDVGNEYNLLKWCEKRNELPPYQLFDRKPFDAVDIENVKLINDNEWSTSSVDFSDTDLIVSVPVCSGLSQATIAKDETKLARNNNMIFNAEYALGKIQPKVYIFENAPTLFSALGLDVRNIINDIGKKYGYSIVYYKTNTKFHDNCQNRPRTFVIMIKKRTEKDGCPEMMYEHISPTIEEYFSRIPKDATQQENIEMSPLNKLIMKYVFHKYGKDFRNAKTGWSLNPIIEDGEKFYDWLDTVDDDEELVKKLKSSVEHIHYKLSLNKNYYAIAPSWFTANSETAPVCMFKTILNTIHYKEDRLLNIREWLHLMGHPSDFEFYGDYKSNYAKLGQNVPARTARFIVSEGLRIIKNWETIDRNKPEIYMFDNTKIKPQKATKSLF